MASSGEAYPSRDDVIAYLEAYEARYDLPLRRPSRVTAVNAAPDALLVQSEDAVEGAGRYQRHRAHGHAFYSPLSRSGALRRRSVAFGTLRWTARLPQAAGAIVGGGNGGAILAEVSEVADATWVTPRERSSAR